MDDRNVSMGCVIAYGLWVVVGLCLLFSWVLWDHQAAEHLGRAGLAASAAAATASIRMFHCRSNRLIRAAYELGREDRRADIQPMR